MLNNSSINRVFLVGFISKEPRCHIRNGERVLYFPVTTTEKIKRNGVMEDHYELHQVRIAEQATDPAKLCKGSVVHIQGRIETRSYVDEQSVKRYVTTILADSAKPVPAQVTSASHAALHT
ncbi:single-stranded DNA-binding protein [Mucilaginibacter sp. L3T2-6]|uniref:single-stranded DNA-binding protein n=1 Tax=Mucilaginibacter sp. L3T2-6 TaxID=3062491 RepID=UPI00267473F5|nr:single-stranded DNA-binding protein [Mucilaginibacter sp. L3T2-6]MDO3644895.1 single-stranded DNA-binding protein [Mucilaginibacter sp. L3T2-6]MDV6217346.1 single-stranded DNA-binding protein [Mucilaginibacter sp. L3T2-6]